MIQHKILASQILCDICDCVEELRNLITHGNEFWTVYFANEHCYCSLQNVGWCVVTVRTHQGFSLSDSRLQSHLVVHASLNMMITWLVLYCLRPSWLKYLLNDFLYVAFLSLFIQLQLNLFIFILFIDIFPSVLFGDWKRILLIVTCCTIPKKIDVWRQT